MIPMGNGREHILSVLKDPGLTPRSILKSMESWLLFQSLHFSKIPPGGSGCQPDICILLGKSCHAPSLHYPSNQLRLWDPGIYVFRKNTALLNKLTIKSGVSVGRQGTRASEQVHCKR